jgi:hypothetical protein
MTLSSLKMNYEKTFNDVADHLSNQNISVDIIEGEKLSPSELENLQDTLKVTLPTELKKYLSELGDGFGLQYSFGDDVLGWGLDHTEDIIDEREDFLEKLESIIDGSGEDYGYHNVTSHDIATAKQKLSWLPIYGIGLGGSVFCIETNSQSNGIHFVDTSYEILMPSNKAFTLSFSLNQFIEDWSRYCFSNPSSTHFTTFAHNKAGPFEWDPKIFLKQFDQTK